MIPKSLKIDLGEARAPLETPGAALGYPWSARDAKITSNLTRNYKKITLTYLEIHIKSPS